MEDCDLENCRFSKTNPQCQKCFPVRVKCRTCGHVQDFKVDDPDRGDDYIRDNPPEDWPCPHCEARMMGVFDRRIDVGNQSTLEALFG